MTNQQRFLLELAELLKVKPFSEGDIAKIMHAVERVYFQEIPSCLAKADQAEPIFVLRGQDQSAPDVVQWWLTFNQESIPPDKYRAAVQVYESMVVWPVKKQAD